MERTEFNLITPQRLSALSLTAYGHFSLEAARGNNKCYEGTLQIVNPVNLLFNPEATEVVMEGGRRESRPGWAKHLLHIWPHARLMQTRECALLREEVFKILSFLRQGLTIHSLAVLKLTM